MLLHLHQIILYISERLTIDDKITNTKTDREASKVSELLSGKIDKYEYLTGEEILPLDQSRLIEQLKIKEENKFEL